MNCNRYSTLLVTALTAACLFASSRAKDSQPTGKSPDQSNKKPNIVVIMTDDQRWDSLSCYADPVVKTPHVDALAKEGTKFENAFTVAVLCCPSRTCFFTGKYASKNGCFDNKTNHEVTAIGKPSTADPFAYQLEDAPDTVVLGAGDRFHLS